MNEINCVYCDENGVCHLHSTQIVVVPCKGYSECDEYVKGE